MPLIGLITGALLGKSIFSLSICLIVVHLVNIQIWLLKYNSKTVLFQSGINVLLLSMASQTSYTLILFFLLSVILATYFSQVYLAKTVYRVEFTFVIGILLILIGRFQTDTLMDAKWTLAIVVLLFLTSTLLQNRKDSFRSSVRILYSLATVTSLTLLISTKQQVFLILLLFSLNVLLSTFGRTRR
jgi:hypothetical protein